MTSACHRCFLRMIQDKVVAVNTIAARMPKSQRIADSSEDSTSSAANRCSSSPTCRSTLSTAGRAGRTAASSRQLFASGYYLLPPQASTSSSNGMQCARGGSEPPRHHTHTGTRTRTHALRPSVRPFVRRIVVVAAAQPRSIALAPSVPHAAPLVTHAQECTPSRCRRAAELRLIGSQPLALRRRGRCRRGPAAACKLGTARPLPWATPRTAAPPRVRCTD